MTHFYVDQFYQWFMLNVGETPLGDHYFLPSTKLNLTRNSAYEFELTLVHKKKEIPPKLDCLPLELLRYISSFLTYKHKVVMGFMCPNDYPFLPPTWYMRENGDFILMNTAVIQHNYENSVPGNWSSQSFEADILQMVVRILEVMD